MVSAEIAEALAPFFDRIGPSHDQLTMLFRRSNLAAADPVRDPSDVIGKMKRVREVLSYAVAFDPQAGAKLVATLLAAMRACGSFRPGSENNPGEWRIRALKDAFDREGWILTSEGTLLRKNLENLDGTQLTDALEAYARRAVGGDSDAALLVGTVKDLVEATARHVLVEASGAYPQHGTFPSTLFLAFERVGLATPSLDVMKELERDPVRALQQALFLAACAVNRYRNEEGSGHGRPHPSKATLDQARLASNVAGVVTQMLLAALKTPQPAATSS